MEKQTSSWTETEQHKLSTKKWTTPMAIRAGSRSLPSCSVPAPVGLEPPELSISIPQAARPERFVFCSDSDTAVPVLPKLHTSAQSPRQANFSVLFHPGGHCWAGADLVPNFNKECISSPTVHKAGAQAFVAAVDTLGS